MANEDNKHKFVVRLPKNVYDLIEKEATRIGISSNSLILFMLDEYLKIHGLSGAP